MFKSAKTTDLSQISITGVRALVFIGLLIMQPRTMDEIRQALIDLKFMDESNSNDILRIDLNTIKLMGCEVSRPSAKTNNKYVLEKHPFSLKIPEKEIEILKKVYNYVKQDADLDLIMQYDNLFKKIAFYLCDEASKEQMLGISVLKYFDVEMLYGLIQDCLNRNIVTLIYKKPTSTKETTRQVLAEKVVYKNDKIYLYGFDMDVNKPIVLSLRRIIKILNRRKNDKEIESKGFKIRFILKDIRQEDLEINEEIIDELSEGYLIEGIYHNPFLATQRVLSFGSRCIVLEPEEFKNNLILKIKEMRKNYGY